MNRLPMLCMFCGKDETHGPMNREDFAPRGLWEKGHRPPFVRKVPAHIACNSAFSEDNEYFRDVLALELGAVEKCDAAKLVVEGAIDRKLAKRPGSIAKTLKNFRNRPIVTPSGLLIGEMPGFEVDPTRIQRVLFNVMKGIYFTAQKTPMPLDFQLEVYDTQCIEEDPYRRTVESMVPWQTFGDDAFMCRYRMFGKPTKGMACLMHFYKNRMFYGIAMSPQMEEEEKNREMFLPASPKSPILVPRHRAEY